MPAATAKKPPKDKHNEVDGVKLKKGALTVELFDQEWGPAFCRETNTHGSVALYENATDDEAATADGYDPDCDACRAQVASVIEHARRAANRAV